MDIILQITQTAPSNLVVLATPSTLLEVFEENGEVVNTTPPLATAIEVTLAAPMQLEVLLGTQGPPGVNGISEEDMAYAKRIDFVSETLIYRAEAIPGALESQSAWRIQRLTLASDNDVVSQWADGNANFDNVWADRATLSYT